MVDLLKVVARWRAGAEEDRRVAADLVDRGHLRHGLFFAHLAVEKLLKALVCQRTGELAPYIHDLVRLAGEAQIALDPARRDVLAKMNAYAPAGRYPNMHAAHLTAAEARVRLVEATEVFEWLTTLFPR